MANILKKGTGVCCPRKRHLIGHINRNVSVDDAPRFIFIDFVTGQERIAGEPPECTICGSRYFVQNKTHTQQGWRPTDPVLERPTNY